MSPLQCLLGILATLLIAREWGVWHERRTLRNQLGTLQELCSATYVMAGKVGAPERFLDALVAGSNGEFEDLGREVLDELVPVTLAEFDTKQIYWELNQLGDKNRVSKPTVSDELPSPGGWW